MSDLDFDIDQFMEAHPDVRMAEALERIACALEKLCAMPGISAVPLPAAASSSATYRKPTA
jgi:hypothetical protein